MYLEIRYIVAALLNCSNLLQKTSMFPAVTISILQKYSSPYKVGFGRFAI